MNKKIDEIRGNIHNLGSMNLNAVTADMVYLLQHIEKLNKVVEAVKDYRDYGVAHKNDLLEALKELDEEPKT